MTQLNEKVSIIVPVYDVEKYLDRCVMSLVNQTYNNIEIILVDDGSMDRCPEMCDNYAKRYSNLKVIHKSNGGLSSARNAGLKSATGSIITFVDSDDWVTTDFIEYLYSILKANNADVADIKCIQTTSQQNVFRNDVEKTEVYCNSEILKRYLFRGITEQRGAPYSVWRKMYKREIVINQAFEEGTVNEDICYNYIALSKCNRYVESNQIKYFYFQNPKSITGDALKKKDLDLLKVTENLCELTKSSGDKSQIELAQIKHARSYFSLLMRAALNGVVDVPYAVIKKLQCNLRKNLAILLKSPMPINRKCMSLCISISYVGTSKVIQCVKRLLKK